MGDAGSRSYGRRDEIIPFVQFLMEIKVSEKLITNTDEIGFLP